MAFFNVSFRFPLCLTAYDFCMERKTYFVYILMEARDEALRTGIASDLFTRTYELASERQYLVYFETLCGPEAALSRELELRCLDQSVKRNLVERENPGWHDLGMKY